MKLSEINTTWDLAKECAEFQGGFVFLHYLRLKISQAKVWINEMRITIGEKFL